MQNLGDLFFLFKIASRTMSYKCSSIRDNKIGSTQSSPIPFVTEDRRYHILMCIVTDLRFPFSIVFLNKGIGQYLLNTKNETIAHVYAITLIYLPYILVKLYIGTYIFLHKFMCLIQAEKGLYEHGLDRIITSLPMYLKTPIATIAISGRQDHQIHTQQERQFV